MTRQTFYRKLRKYANLFRWKLAADGELRGTRGNRKYCPLTAVYYAEQEKYLDICELKYVAHTLNIDYDQSELIAGSSDFSKQYLPPSEVCYYDHNIRKTLLRSVGLEEN